MCETHDTDISYYSVIPIGKCKVCGCTENNACCHPEYGPCWWTDYYEDLCSHCAGEDHPNSLASLILMEKESEI